MLAIAATDSRRYIIPNELTAAAFALALLRAGRSARMRLGGGAVARQRPGVALPLLALMVGYRCWRGRDGLGLGDIKLAAVAGAWLGFVTLFAVVELATHSALGAYFLTSAILRKRPLRGDRLPALRAVPGAGDLARLAGRGVLTTRLGTSPIMAPDCRGTISAARGWRHSSDCHPLSGSAAAFQRLQRRRR